MSRFSFICAEKELKPYFKELVEGAVFHQSLKVTDMSQFYLVNLLDEFVKTDQLFDWKADHYEETPLAFLLSKALKSDPAERIKTFKKLGDISLYIAGYFTDHIDSKMVDVDYYISMGEGAYKNLSGMLVSEKTFCRLYDELSVKFVRLMDILAEVRNSSGVASNSELIRLYERWLKTGDPRIRELLEKEGITLQKIDPKGKKR